MTTPTMTSNLQFESCSAVHPYVLLSTYRLLVCQVCGFAPVADEVATHLKTRHRDIQLEHRQELVKKITKSRISSVVRTNYVIYGTQRVRLNPFRFLRHQNQTG